MALTNGNGPVRLPPAIVYLVIGTVCLIWAAANVVDFTSENYAVPSAVNNVFFAVVGAAIGGPIIRGLIRGGP